MLPGEAPFDNNVRKLIDAWHVPGLGVAVIEGDKIHAKGYGVAQLDGPACTEDTLFDCASTSKSFTAACVGLLVEDPAFPDVQWRTPVCRILPDDFVLPDPYSTAEVTIEDILSHRTGEPGHDNSLLGQQSALSDNAKSITRNLRNLPFNKPLRCDYQYSNLMYTVATHLIEVVTGKSYINFVRKRIWEPLGMLSTYHDIPNVEAGHARDRLAMGHHWDRESGEYFTIPSYAQPEGQGAGCVFSSVGDYVKWVHALIQHAAPLSKNTHKELIKGRTIVPFEGNEALPRYGHSLYALGLIVESYRGHQVIGHDGSFYGFKALMRYLPQQEWGVVVFGNASNAFFVHQILLHEMMDEVLGIRKEKRTDWPAYWRNCYEDEEKEDADQDLELQPPEVPESIPVALKELAGEYCNSGYHSIVVAHKEGTLEADCTDRCMPFKLRFNHISGRSFVVDYEDVLMRSTRKMKVEFMIEKGIVQAFGIPLCDEMKDELIWFMRRNG